MKIFDNEILKKYLLSAMFPIYFFLVNLSNMNFHEINNMGDVFIFIHGGFNISNLYRNPLLITSIISPFIYLIYLVGDYVSCDIKTSGPYVFTRTNSKNSWFLSKTKDVFVFTFVYDLIHFIVLFLLAYHYKYRINAGSFIVILQIFSLTLLFTYLFALSYNVLNLFMKNTIGLTIIISGTICSLMSTSIMIKNYEITGYLNRFIFRVLPTSNVFLYIENLIVSNPKSLFNNIIDYNIFLPTSTLVFQILLVNLIGIYKINKMDII